MQAILERADRLDPKGEYSRNFVGALGASYCPEGRHASVLQRWDEGLSCWFCQLTVFWHKDEMMKRNSMIKG
jgi:hypothetical protein